MRVGLSLFFQNYNDWGRFEARDEEAPVGLDAGVYADELALADLAADHGFDSLWTVEHRVSPYTLVPDPSVMLAYLAGRTKLDIGTMVIVLPWHDPLQTAEHITMLDNLLEGRRLTIGFGRGAGKREFSALRVPMNESRERFLEALEIVRKALTNERFSHDGEFYQIPETTVRPRPRSADLLDRMYCAWGSPETLPIAAEAGLNMLVIPQASWETYADQMRQFNGIRARHGWEPVQPIIVSNVFCDEDPDEARKLAVHHITEYYETVTWHYRFQELDDPSYKYYKQMAAGIKHVADTAKLKTPEEYLGNAFDWVHGSVVCGTPDQCVEKLTEVQEMTGASEVVCVFKYGSMTRDVAAKSLRLFAEKALPQVKGLDAKLPNL